MVKIIIHIPSLRKTLRRLSCGLLCNRAEESTQSIPNQSVSINQHHAGDENDWDLQPEHDVTSGIQNEDSPKTPNISESDKPVSRPSRYRNKRPSPLINDVPGMPLPNASNQEPFVPKEEAAEAAETASNITVEITPIEQEDVTTRPSSWTQEMTEFGRSIFNTSPLQLSPPHTYLNSTASQRHREIDSETLYSLAEETEADVIPSFHPYSIITPPPHISRSKTVPPRLYHISPRPPTPPLPQIPPPSRKPSPRLSVLQTLPPEIASRTRYRGRKTTTSVSPLYISTTSTTPSNASPSPPSSPKLTLQFHHRARSNSGSSSVSGKSYAWNQPLAHLIPEGCKIMHSQSKNHLRVVPRRPMSPLNEGGTRMSGDGGALW